MEIPQKFKDSIGEEVEYLLGKHRKCVGIIKDARFSKSQIWDKKTGEKFYGIEFKIKPTDGFNQGRAIWTRAFSSGIKIEKQ